MRTNGVSEMREASETPVCLEREWRCEGREESMTKIAPTQIMGEGEERGLYTTDRQGEEEHV